jgi:hypothetical protein
MALVDSVEVETYTVALGSTTPGSDITLSTHGGGTITSSTNVVPFYTRTYGAGNTAPVDWDSMMFAVHFPTSTTMRIERDGNTSNTWDLHVNLVKFNETAVLVQSGSFDVNISGTTTATLGTNVDSAKSFIVTNNMQSSSVANESVGNHAVSARFTTEGSSVNGLTFERGPSNTGTHHCKYYVITSLTGEFTVDHVVANMAATEGSANVSIGSVTASSTALFGSYHTTHDSESANGSSLVTARLNGTNATIERASTSDTVEWRGQVVKFTDNTTVYQGSESITAAAEDAANGSQSVTIGGSVDASRSIAMPSGLSGNLHGGCRGAASTTNHNWVSGNTSYELVGDPATTFTLNFRSLDADFLDRTFEWQVIEWDDGSGAPAPSRRFMVIS